MDLTPNLGLPYIMAAQSQKHVTHNEAIRALDAVVQLSVLDRDLNAPPASPAEGARYIVAASPTGAWSGHAGNIAAYQDGAWMFYAPLEGWIAWVADEDAAVVWSGSGWSALTTGSGGAGTFATVGVNATADATNRLAVKSDAVLFSHDDVTPGNGSIQHKLNKQTAAKTATFLFQTNWSGRAEMGLAGDDDFHFKVSADGTTWKEAMVIDRASGSVRFPLTGGREVLTGPRTYYVRTDGSDSNTGLADTAGGAFLTIQKAITAVAALDISIFNATIQVGAGTYTAPITLANPVGAGACILRGDTTTPANVVISTTGATCIGGNNVAWTIEGFKLQTTTSGNGIWVRANSRITLGAMEYGACAGAHIVATEGAQVAAQTANYIISGGATRHLWVETGGRILTTGTTATLSGTPAFPACFANAAMGGIIQANSMTYVGSATGSRYSASSNGVIFVNGAGASYFPGNGGGGTSTGGQYV